LKSDIATRHIPVVFMTGLTESEHVVSAFAAGGADYVTKPVRPGEVLARIATHIQSSRLMQQARSALDAFGRATISILLRNGYLVWQTPLARSLLAKYRILESQPEMDRLFAWMRLAADAHSSHKPPGSHVFVQGAESLIFTFFEHTVDGECLLVLHEESDAVKIDAMMHALNLTRRESEVLYWLVKGKTNRDIGDILVMSPRTVNKHLEHVFQKLNVETRTAAAAVALGKVRTLESSPH
jgi:DNA-binding NarL/FixJ family response regulator